MSGPSERDLRLAEKLARRLTALDTEARRPAAQRVLAAWPPDETVQALSGLILRREAGDARAREALVAVVEALSDLGEQDEVSDLLAYARAHRVMPVARLLERPGPARTFRLEEEISVDREMREKTLGFRKQLARTATRQELIRLLGDPDPEVVRNLLTHPKLTEPDVIRLASRRPGRAAVLQEVFRSARWNVRQRVQRALANNPYTPTEMALKLVALLPLTDARELAADPNLHQAVRNAAGARVTLGKARQAGARAAASSEDGEKDGED